MSRTSEVSGKPLVILFGGWGRQQTILKLKKEGYSIAGVITPGNPSTKLQESIEEIELAEIRIISIDKSDLEKTLSEFKNHLLISIGFPYLLSKTILDEFYPALNVHPTLLPKFRGPTTLAYVIMNGEEETGSTIHYIDEGMDTGPIVCQSSVKISRFDTLRSLQKKVYAHEPELLINALKLLDSPKFVPQQQNEKDAVIFAKRRKPADSEIDPRKPLIDLYDEIRASDPEDFPAFFYVGGQKVCVKFWWPDIDSGEKPA